MGISSKHLYRTSIGVRAFILAGAMALVIALAAVSYQFIKAAVTRPIDHCDMSDTRTAHGARRTAYRVKE